MLKAVSNLLQRGIISKSSKKNIIECEIANRKKENNYNIKIWLYEFIL